MLSLSKKKKKKPFGKGLFDILFFVTTVLWELVSQYSQ